MIQPRREALRPGEEPGWERQAALVILALAFGGAFEAYVALGGWSPTATGPSGAEVLPSSTGLYPTMNPFEHSDPSRTHLHPDFQVADPLLTGEAEVNVEEVACLRNPWLAVTRERGELFVLGGNSGGASCPETCDLEGVSCNGSGYLAAIDLSGPHPSLSYAVELPDGEVGLSQWDYPGGLLAHANGDIFALTNGRLHRFDPDSRTLSTLVIPYEEQGRSPDGEPYRVDPADVAYNGFNVLPDGRLLAKTLIARPPGCDADGMGPLVTCRGDIDPDQPTVFTLIDPETLEVALQARFDGFMPARPTVAVFEGEAYVYETGGSTLFRLRYDPGEPGAAPRLEVDEGWGPVSYITEGEVGSTAPAILGEWVVVQSNGGISREVPSAVTVVHQGRADLRQSLVLFDEREDRVSASWAFVPPAIDPANHRLVATDVFTGLTAGVDLDPRTGALSRRWIRHQTSLGYISLVGPADRRVFVAADLSGQTRERVVWRDSLTGEVLASSREFGSSAGSPLVFTDGAETCFLSTGDAALYVLSLTAP